MLFKKNIWVIIPYILFLFSITFFCSCSDDAPEVGTPSYVSCDEVTFCDSLIYELQTHIEERVNETITEKFNFFSLNSWRMIKDSFWSKDSTRIEEWAKAFKVQGLTTKDFSELINKRIEQFNSTHESHLSPVVLSEFNDTAIINSQAFEDIENLDLIGALDVLDVVFTFIPIMPLLGFIIAFIIGFLILRPIFIIIRFFPEKETLRFFVKLLVPIFMAVIYFILIYHSIRLSAELESTIITNYINYLYEQNIPVQIFK